jgi:hypothetical protein
MDKNNYDNNNIHHPSQTFNNPFPNIKLNRTPTKEIEK